MRIDLVPKSTVLTLTTTTMLVYTKVCGIIRIASLQTTSSVLSLGVGTVWLEIIVDFKNQSFTYFVYPLLQCLSPFQRSPVQVY